jgi:hypothetical protein
MILLISGMSLPRSTRFAAVCIDASHCFSHFFIHKPRVCCVPPTPTKKNVADKLRRYSGKNVGDELRADVADRLRRYRIEVVEVSGFEPPASRVQGGRSPG